MQSTSLEDERKDNEDNNSSGEGMNNIFIF